jgi:hypothetical protein
VYVSIKPLTKSKSVRNRKTGNSARNEDTDTTAGCLLDTMYSLFNHSRQVPCIVSVDNIRKEPRCFLGFGRFEKGQEVFNNYLPAPASGVLSKVQRQEVLGEMLDDRASARGASRDL